MKQFSLLVLCCLAVTAASAQDALADAFAYGRQKDYIKAEAIFEKYITQLKPDTLRVLADIKLWNHKDTASYLAMHRKACMADGKYEKFYNIFSEGRQVRGDLLIPMDSAKGVRLIKDFALGGDQKAMKFLAYLNSWQMPASMWNALKEEQLYWMLQLLKAGDSSMLSSIAIEYNERNDYKQAKYYFEKALEAGNAYGASALSRLYKEGKGVEIDLPKARAYMKMALEMAKDDWWRKQFKKDLADMPPAAPSVPQQYQVTQLVNQLTSAAPTAFGRLMNAERSTQGRSDYYATTKKFNTTISDPFLLESNITQSTYKNGTLSTFFGRLSGQLHYTEVTPFFEQWVARLKAALPSWEFRKGDQAVYFKSRVDGVSTTVQLAIRAGGYVVLLVEADPRQ